MKRFHAQIASFAAVTITAGAGFALPAERSSSDTVDDATLTVRVHSETISGDANSWCELRVQDAGTDVELTANDTFFLWVYEDDTVGNDEIWSFEYTVTAADVAAGMVDQTFDCSGFFDSDGFGSNLEIFAEGRFEKDKCGTFCRYDRPNTSNIDSAEVEDDNHEEDDASTDATAIAEGRTSNRIARDDDWYEITLAAPGTITFAAEQFMVAGEANVAIFDQALTEIGAGMALADRWEATTGNLGAGTYYARVQLEQPLDFAFYDVLLSIEDANIDCAPGTEESRDCAMCGTETRTCDNMGAWSGWSACSSQGECEPGATTTESCGNCGEVVTTCTDACQWQQGAGCENEGECPAGAVEQQMCAGGTQERLCNDSCAWGMFGECKQSPLGSACADASTCDDFLCVSGGGLFRGGYCGKAACTSDAECGSTGVCMNAFGANYCLLECTTDAECRPEYRCATDGGKRGCAPRCTSDSQCAGQTCDIDTGVCAGGTAGGGNNGTVDPGVPGGADMGMESDGGDDGGTADSGCGCASAPGSDASIWLLLLAMIPLRRRRRR